MTRRYKSAVVFDGIRGPTSRPPMSNASPVAFASSLALSKNRYHLTTVSRRPRFPGASVSIRTSCPSVHQKYRPSCCAQSTSLTFPAAGVDRKNAAESLAKSTSLLTAFSSFIGVLVLIGSLLYKVPQIVRIVRRRSARGISVLYYALETLGMTFSAVYFARRSFPFVTYGETLFIMFTNVIVLTLISKYERLPLKSCVISAVCYAAVLLFLFSPGAPLSLLVFLQIVSIPLLNLAKIPQILLNYSRKDTGELAPTTLGLQLLGNAARIFTTLAQVQDTLMLLSTLVSFCFNTALFGQWCYYSQRKPPVPVTE